MIKTLTKYLSSGFFAGLMITIGCTVYLSMQPNWMGAVIFCVALLSICYLGLSLYTGKIGFIFDNANKDGVCDLLLGLLGNVAATLFFGWLVSVALPNLSNVAVAICKAKASQTFAQTLIRAFFCGVLMYVAVAIFKQKNSPIGILFCIPAFILSGFEHSIADVAYLAISNAYSWHMVGFLATVLLGNSVGAIAAYWLNKLRA